MQGASARRLYWGHMSRRLVAFLAAFLLSALPVAKVVCGAACAHAAGSMGSGHACCHDTQSSKTLSLGTLTQLCDHPADAPTTTQSQDASSAPAVATNVVAFIALDAPSRGAAPRSASPLSNPLSLTTQLRI